MDDIAVFEPRLAVWPAGSGKVFTLGPGNHPVFSARAVVHVIAAA
jgi:hypothetical protein